MAGLADAALQGREAAMNFALSDDQKALVELARKILADKATHERHQGESRRAPRASTASCGARWPTRTCSARACPRSSAAAGSASSSCVSCSRRSAARSRRCRYFATLALGALPLAQFGSAEQKRRWLPGRDRRRDAPHRGARGARRRRPAAPVDARGARRRGLAHHRHQDLRARGARRRARARARGDGPGPDGPGSGSIRRRAACGSRLQRATNREVVATLTLAAREGEGDRTCSARSARGREIARWIARARDRRLCARCRSAWPSARCA